MPKILIGPLLALAALPPIAQAQTLDELARQVLQTPTAASALTDSDIAAGLRQALAQGTRAAVKQLGHADGFWGSDRFRIPLPRVVEKATPLLQAAGYGEQVDDLHLQINRAAEKAVPLAADVFAQAVSQLTLDDARSILNGPPNAATQYFRRTTRGTLMERFKPMVASVTARVGLVQRYDNLLSSVGPAASLLGDKADLNTYVTNKALDALFARVGDEEKAIRSNPAARTTELLRKVFGNGG